MLGETMALVHRRGVNSDNAAKKETYNRVHGNAVSLQEKVEVHVSRVPVRSWLSRMTADILSWWQFIFTTLCPLICHFNNTG